jgi:hypothetical protein
VLVTLLFLASCAAATAPHIENAVTIHTATRDYLEFDIAPWRGCPSSLVLFDVNLRGGHTALVGWVQYPDIVETLCVSPRRVNVLLPFPDSIGGAHGALIIDTLVDQGSGNIVTKIGRVVNPALQPMCPTIACMLPDSATAFQKVQARIRASSFVATFAPFHTATFAPISPWSNTTGLEDFPEVALPLPGNAGNWIDEDAVQLRMDSLIAGSIASPCPPGTVCPLLVVRPSVRLPTGPVQYVYQQSADPFNADTSGSGTPFVQDTLLKIGSRLHLSGYVSHPCGRQPVDSELINETLWLVASGGSQADSLTMAFQQPSYCGSARTGAWPMRNGKVEITQGVWVPLLDLVGTTGVLPAKARVAGATLRRVGQAANLELPAPACVRAVDLSGREILPSTPFAAGHHSLLLPQGHGMVFVQVRTGLSTTTLPLEPAR